MPRKKQPDYVFALVNTTVMCPSRHHLRVGDVYYADSPPVQKHPEMFSDEPPTIHPRGWESPVEQATAAPGEKRTTTRTARNDD